MTPWYGRSLNTITPCTGVRMITKLLLDEIMPEAEALLPGAPAWRASPVTRWLGCSPSAPLPNGCVCPQRVYQFLLGLRHHGICVSREMKPQTWLSVFSLGDKESSTDNPILNVVQQNTQEIETLVPKEGIEPPSCWTVAATYQACNKRTAAGIHWILNR